MPPPPSQAQAVGPYMLQDLVDDLPLDTPDRQNVTITCLEAWSHNLYIGTSAHEILHIVSIPPTPNPNSSEPPKPSYILASRQEPSSSSGALGARPFIKQILVLPSVLKAVVLSSTGALSFYSLPEFSPALRGTKLNNVLFIGGLDLTEEEEGGDDGHAGGAAEAQDPRKLVMVLAKGKIRMIKVGDEARLIKDIPLPGAVNAMRRGTIACVATREKYALLDVDGLQQMPLFPLTSSAGEPASASESESEPPSRASTSSPAQPARGSHHPPRVSSLATSGRERRNSSAATTRESTSTPSGHSRSASAGNVSRTPSHTDRPAPARRGSTLAPGSLSGGQTLSPPEPGSPRTSPTASPRIGSTTGRNSPRPAATGSARTSPVPPGSPRSRASPSVPRTGAAAPPASAPPGSPRSRVSSPAPRTAATAPPAPARALLKPHIASPTPTEFLLTTGTKPEDAGVGLFVDTEGNVTRGTIQFDKYPDQVIVDGRWVIAVIPDIGLNLQKWEISGESPGDMDKEATITFDTPVHLKQVLGPMDGCVVTAVSRKLRLVHLPLRTDLIGEDDFPGDEGRNQEERVIAERISTIETKVVVFDSRKVWSLLPSPLVLRLDARLPSFSDNFDGIVARVRSVLQVLEEASSIEPSTERAFHEVSFIRQKCGLLVLGELLRITSRQTSDISARDIIRVEQALSESNLDPRFIVALYGSAFEPDLVEGDSGVWIYGGIREVFRNIKISPEVGNSFTRDALLLLKRYLADWRNKKGFGSVASDKEVFLTVDAALLRVMLMLDSPTYLVEKGKTVVSEGNIRLELYKFAESRLENRRYAIEILESFNRLYVLSIVHSASKDYAAVLQTWRRLLEEGDPTDEFADGEERVKLYLLRMKDPALVEEHGAWLAERNPPIGIQVFADEKARVRFEPPKVLEILRARAPDAVRGYVEHLVLQKKDTQYTNELIMLYLEELTRVLDTDESAIERLRLSYDSYCALESPKPTYREFIVENSPPADEDSWWHDRLRLLDLLGGDSGYDVAKVSALVNKYREVLVPEMVILYGREGKHGDALALLTHELNDFDTAVNYCLFGGWSLFQTRAIITERAEQSRLFEMLLNEFLKLRDMGARIQQTAMLLEKFGGWLDVIHVLSVIPDEWSIEILSKFLVSALRRLVRERAEVGLERSLNRAENFKVEAAYVEECDRIGPTIEREG